MHFALVDGVHLMLKIDEWGEMPKQSEPHSQTCAESLAAVGVVWWLLDCQKVGCHPIIQFLHQHFSRRDIFLFFQCIADRMVPMFTWAHNTDLVICPCSHGHCTV
jgi:hypothetical protein